jgi:RNA polymerase sigma-70 factor (ECF subfamily)
LGDFWELRRRDLLAYIERRLGAALRRKVEPGDILQETSAEAVRARAAVDFTKHDPFGWLCQLAERRIVDAHRRYFGAQKRAAGREVSLGSPFNDTSRPGIIDLLAASLTTASEAFSRDQRHLRLLAALETLPAEMQKALRLRYVDGLPSKDIAQQLGKSDGAVRVLLTRGIGKLRDELGKP